MELSEPSQMITDYILALVIIILGVFIQKKAQLDQKIRKFFVSSFILLGLAAFFGGTYHGFRWELDPTFIAIVWKITLFSVGFTDYALVMGYGRFSLREEYHAKLNLIAIAKLTIYLIAALFTDDFMIVIYDVAPVFLFAGIMQYQNYKNKKIRTLLWEGIAVVLALIAMVVHLTNFGLHEYMTSGDIAHFLLMGVGYMLYRSIIEMN